MADDAHAQRKLLLVRGFSANVPHNNALGIEILELAHGQALFRLPYDEKLVGNPDTGVLHGGAITALLDGASGAAVFAALTELVPIATLDLRIDYLRPAEAGQRGDRARDLLQARHATSRSRAPSPTTTIPTIRSRTRSGTFMVGTKLGTSTAMSAASSCSTPAKQAHDFTGLLDAIPYATFLGLTRARWRATS